MSIWIRNDQADPGTEIELAPHVVNTIIIEFNNRVINHERAAREVGSDARVGGSDMEIAQMLRERAEGYDKVIRLIQDTEVEPDA